MLASKPSCMEKINAKLNKRITDFIRFKDKLKNNIDIFMN